LIDRFLPVALGEADVELPTIGPGESDHETVDTDAAVLPFVRAV
jgi:hypothetical protein